MSNSSIKDETLYKDLRKKATKTCAKRVTPSRKPPAFANAAASRGRSSARKPGGKSGSNQDWTVPQLKKKAKELGITGYSKLNRAS
jgi:hypothetical protein